MLTKLHQIPSFLRTLSTSSPLQCAPKVLTEPLHQTFPIKGQQPRQVWLENMDTIDEKKLSILELHPEVFAANPRIDLIHKNVQWQIQYRFVSWAHTKTRFEARGGGKKPWPQKGIQRKLLPLFLLIMVHFRIGSCTSRFHSKSSFQRRRRRSWTQSSHTSLLHVALL